MRRARRSRGSAGRQCRPGPGPPPGPADRPRPRGRPHRRPRPAGRACAGAPRRAVPARAGPASGRSTFARLPRWAPASAPCRHRRVGPRPQRDDSLLRRRDGQQDGGACRLQRRDDVGRRDAEGEADRGGRRGQDRVDLAGVVVVVPRRLAEGRPDDRGVGLEPRDVGGQALGIGRRGARDKEVHAERVHAGGPDGRHLLRQSRPSSCTRRRGSSARPPGWSPPRGPPSTAHPPWAPRRAASGRGRAVSHPHSYPPAATVGNPWTSTSSTRCAAPVPPANSTPSRWTTRCWPGCSTPPASRPSGGNRQGWRVIVVRDPAARVALRDLYLSGWYEYLAMVLGRPGALGAGHRPCGRGGGRRQRGALRRGRVPPHPASPRRSIPLPPSSSSWPTWPRSPPSTATCPLHLRRRRLHLPLRLEPAAGGADPRVSAAS